MTGNGTFSFPWPLSDRFPYAVSVRAQPTAPNQICSVSNGQGEIDGADVTSVLVACSTPVVNGSLDPSFASGGLAFTSPASPELALLLQPDGKVLVAGGGSDFVLMRFNADGSPDAGFGTQGTVTTDVANGFDDEAFGLALQPDGKIVVVGRAVVGRTARDQFDYDFALARYLPDGSLDVSFGTGGTVTTDFNDVLDEAHAVVIQPDGKIVLVGIVAFDTPTGIGAGSDFGLARYDGTGNLDASFGSGGKLTTDIAGGVDRAEHVALLADGSLLLAGPISIGSGAVLEHTGMARYSTNGVLDAGFGVGGTLTLADLDVGRGMVLQADGKILVGGSTLVGANTDFALARFEPTGVLDASFANGGMLRLDFFGGTDFIQALAVQPDGKLLLAGGVQSGLLRGVGVARVLP